MVPIGRNATIAIWDESGGDNIDKKSPLRMKRISLDREYFFVEITPHTINRCCGDAYFVLID